MGLLGFIEEGVHHESVSVIAWDCWSDGACTSRVQVCEMGRAQARLLNRLNTQILYWMTWRTLIAWAPMYFLLCVVNTPDL